MSKTITNLDKWFDIIMGTPPTKKVTQTQWFIVDKDTGEVVEGTNRSTLKDCIYWYVEAEILIEPNTGDPKFKKYLKDLWKEISVRDNVSFMEFILK